MKQIVDDISDMMELFEQEVEVYPAIPDENTRLLRVELLSEEYHEYLKAEYDNDLVEIYDALLDQIVIIMGTAHAYGLGDIMAEGWDEVHRSNMAKADLVTGKLIRREDGKILKPEGWTPPDLASIIERAKR